MVSCEADKRTISEEILCPLVKDWIAHLCRSFKWGDGECVATSSHLAKLPEKRFMSPPHRKCLDLIPRCGLHSAGCTQASSLLKSGEYHLDCEPFSRACSVFSHQKKELEKGTNI